MPKKLRLVAAILGIVLLGFAVGSALDAIRLPGVDIAQTDAVAQLQTDTSAPSVGPEGAPVTVIIFTDYRCAVCRRDHDGISEVIASEPQTRFVMKEWAVLGPQSKQMARLALAAHHQGQYLTVRDALMRGDTLALEKAALHRSEQQYRAAIDAELARTSRQAFALGLPGTPAYLIGERLVVGSLSKRQLRRLIARAKVG